MWCTCEVSCYGRIDPSKAPLQPLIHSHASFWEAVLRDSLNRPMKFSFSLIFACGGYTEISVIFNNIQLFCLDLELDFLFDLPYQE